MENKVFKFKNLLMGLSVILLMFIVVFGLSSKVVLGLEEETPPIEVIEDDPIIEEEVPPVVEDEVIIVEEEKLGFFESVVTGFFNFVTSAQFTALVTSLTMASGGIYLFVRKYLTAKGDAKWRKVTEDLRDSKEQILNYQALIEQYAKIADGALKQQNAISDSLKLGFESSNLKQDVKDKITNTLNAIPEIKLPELQKVEPLQIIKKDINPIIKEELVNTEKPVINKGW